MNDTNNPNNLDNKINENIDINDNKENIDNNLKEQAMSFPVCQGLGFYELEELDDILADVGSRIEQSPSWEFCDGFLTALICTRRTIVPAEYFSLLFSDGDSFTVQDGDPLPLFETFRDIAQQNRFIELWKKRWDAIEVSLDIPENQRKRDNIFQPEVEDIRAIIAALPPEERSHVEGQELPAFAQVWALGFMFAIENWPEEWAAPRDKKAAGWLDAALQCIVALTEDDTATPVANAYGEKDVATISQERLNAFHDAIDAIYDLRQIWKAIGPRLEPIQKTPNPGRNDPCPCGSGKKFKKCCGG